MEGSTADTVMMRTALAELWIDWMARLAKSHHASSNMLPSTWELQLSCVPIASRMRRVSTGRDSSTLFIALMNGHRGLDLGVHAGVQTPNLDGYEVTRNEGHLVTRSYNGLVVIMTRIEV